ncbi:DUF4097 family beta strand repeat-containing protein [Mucilaginibacter ginsenosidivorax]|uniref:DUF4097 domain-containing protein n=1 Tax=Mucilaginibacter ginsenosidivorax TaxID=862126 RepID=A0A5B8WD23_9SPHI|nr:DUF4097 family beta strand repeat-containing protein [Mucilaginibacter ginsenosidivorax]QEC79838.1 DUF4097 domain-containing protein [Mucilaginibacter ginsenosidivorax]
MKKHLLLFFVACQSCAVFAQDSKTPYMTKPISGAVKDVFVNTSGGSITVSGAPGESPRVEVYIQGNNGIGNISKEEIQKRLENYELSVTVSGGEVHATAKNKHNFANWRNSLSIGFKVFVPKNVNTSLNTSGGSIHLDNLDGTEKFETSGGSLHVDKLTGMIKGQTSGGSIHVSNSGSSIDLETSGGSIEASNCNGKIHLETSGGSLHLTDLKGTIDANTSGGSISANNIAGELKTGTSGGSINLNGLACALDASTSGGSFHAQFASVGKYVKIDVSSGHIDISVPSKSALDLDLRADKVEANFTSNFSGTKEKERIEGKLNGGGSSFEVRGNSRINLNLN